MQIPVTVESPSVRAQPRIVAAVHGRPVSWTPERGWLCADHHAQPCPHTIDLEPVVGR